MNNGKCKVNFISGQTGENFIQIGWIKIYFFLYNKVNALSYNSLQRETATEPGCTLIKVLQSVIRWKKLFNCDSWDKGSRGKWIIPANQHVKLPVDSEGGIIGTDSNSQNDYVSFKLFEIYSIANISLR